MSGIILYPSNIANFQVMGVYAQGAQQPAPASAPTPPPVSGGFVQVADTAELDLNGNHGVTLTAVFDVESGVQVSLSGGALLVAGGSVTCDQASILTMSGSSLLEFGAAGYNVVSLHLTGGSSLATSGTSIFSISSSQSDPNAAVTIGGASSITLSGASQVGLNGNLNIEGATLVFSGDADSESSGAVLACFTTATSGLSVTFTDESYSDNSNGAINSWSWNFGDSNTSTLRNVTHTYGSHGTYSVTLTVTTSGGATGSMSFSVTV